jgi:tetratricopeptide (TPR) repeat protein
MRLRCTNCGGEVEAEVGVCRACGATLGASAGAAETDADDGLDFDIDCEVDQAEIDTVWSTARTAIEGETAAETASQETAVRDIERALVLTGVSDAKGVMGQVIPTPILEFDPVKNSLTPFEGYLLSLVDGTTPIDDIMVLSGLTLFETVMALTSLHDKGAVLMKPIGPASPTAKPSIATTPPRAALGRLELKRARVRREAKDPGELDPDLLVVKSDAALKQGQFEQAREYARLALVQAPNSERAKVLMTVLHEPSHAEGRSKILLGHGLRAFKGKDYAAAIQLLRGALEEYEALAPAHHQLAIALVRSDGDLAEAEQHCRRAIDLAPGNGVYERNLQRIVRRRQGAAPDGPDMA